MALSRTARILVAILLLAAAAFFWVNFFTQNTFLTEEPTTDPSTGTPTTPPPATTVPAAEGEALAEGEADESEDAAAETGDGDASAPTPGEPAEAAAADAAPADPSPGDAAVADDAPADTSDAADSQAEEAPTVAAPTVTAAPVVVVEAPLTLSRNVVVADLPFLITSPPVVTADEGADAATDDASRLLAAARATVNPFSPVVVRVVEAQAPEREVPTAAPVITEVAVPAEPGAIAGPRIATPAPAVRAPAGTVVSDLPRALPTGVPLSATPDLLRQRAAPVERIDVTTVASIRLPGPADAPPAELATMRPTTAVATAIPEVLGPAVAAPATAAAATSAPRAPLAAGTNVLSRFLRDNGYTFTGSALGPVSVGVFRSHGGPTPVVVAIGQTLPNTDIVLTDLRGQQAELTLGDTSQILVLDLRR
jgi:pyruvate dehydrogenase E2 component (dihydrolipoamide acetyltransferase)